MRVIDRERPLVGGGRLDLLLFDEENNRRYEVEIMLGATDASHIVRTIEYWDLERRRFPGYEHVAVLIAEDVTSRFLNVLSLMSGNIPLVGIQLDALSVGEHLVLNFVKVLDQTELRIDDADVDSGGGEVDRHYWDEKAGKPLMRICDEVLSLINEVSPEKQTLNYLRQYIGLRATNGIVRNVVYMSPKPMKNYTHIGFLTSSATDLKERFEEAGLAARSSQSNRVRVSVTPEQFVQHRALIREAIVDTVRSVEG